MIDLSSFYQVEIIKKNYFFLYLCLRKAVKRYPQTMTKYHESIVKPEAATRGVL